MRQTNESRFDSLLADLFDSAQEQAGDLPPSQRFFEATADFWDFMEQFKEKVVTEFGAGNGATVREARQRGFRWAGCDLRGPVIGEASILVHNMSALRFPLVPSGVVIACRPDHSGWVEPALERALRNGASALYVGLPKNLEYDLPKLNGRQVAIAHNAGSDGEDIHLFRPEGY